MYSLSVIIPVYNTEPYLADCLDSLLLRNSFEGEIICINDGSTDGSLQILQDYANRYPNINIISQENQRQGAARNAGIKVAQCDYLLFLDSDDMIVEGCIQRILDQINREDVVYFESCDYTQESQNRTSFSRRRSVRNIRGIEFFEHYFDLTDYSFMSPHALFRNVFIKSNNIEFIPGVFFEDNAWFPRILYNAQSVSLINEPVYIYRIRQGSTMRSSSLAHCRDRLIVAADIIEFCQIHHWFPNKMRQFVWNFDYWDAIEHGLSNSYKRQDFFTLQDWWRMWKCCISSFDRRVTFLALFSFKAALQYKNYLTPRLLRKLYNLVIH